MKSYIITMTEDQESTDAAAKAVMSSVAHENDFGIDIFDATIPEHVDKEMTLYGLKWNWPWKNLEMDIASGITKQPYLTANKNKRIACFLSHYRLWKHCVKENTPLLILEHDAIFTRKVPVHVLDACKYDIIGLNDPRKATRKSEIYHDKVQDADGQFVVQVPKIDFDQVAQGLAGNSAYYIKPKGAKKLIQLVDEYGAWPNDAIMCRQLMPNQLGQIRKYCTTVQRLVSSTTT